MRVRQAADLERERGINTALSMSNAVLINIDEPNRVLDMNNVDLERSNIPLEMEKEILETRNEVLRRGNLEEANMALERERENLVAA